MTPGPTHPGPDDIRVRSAVAPETMFETDEGPLPAEWLRPGHRIRVEDGTFREVVSVEVAATGGGVAVPLDAVEDGVPRAPLTVAPGHLFLIRHPAAAFYFASAAVLVEASDLVGINGIVRVRARQDPPFLHLTLAEAAVAVADGIGCAMEGPGGTLPPYPVLHEADALVLRDALRREWQAHRQSA